MLDILLYYSTGFLLYSMVWALPSLFIGVIYSVQQSLAHGRAMDKFGECVYIKDFIIMVICYPITIILATLVLIGLLWEAIGGLRIAEKVIKFLNKKVV